jgi:hypothetical protein
VHVTRLVIEEGDRSFSLVLHPRLTVVAGVGEGARTGLVREIIGGLGSTRRGVNLEVCDDHGRRLAVLRPAEGGHRVIDLADGTDVSEEFRGPDGRLDLLNRWGLDTRRARGLLHLDRDGLRSEARQGEAILRLADLNQTELWSTAARVRITDDEMRSAVSEATLNDEDPDLIDRIEREHQATEEAASKQRQLRRDTRLVCAASLVLAVPVGNVKPLLFAPMLAIASATALLSLWLRARVARAERSERAALAAAGADSYLGFVVRRVNDLMDDTEARRRRIAVAEDHRAAAVRWTQIAGDVSVDWALSHHEEIEAAARLKRELKSLAQMSATAPEVDESTTMMAQSLVGHIGRLRTIGSDQESFPLILDDPFTEVAPSTKLMLMELLARSSGSPQVILLTDQDEVASWARLEALTGEVGLVEPHIETTTERSSGGMAV